MILRMLYLNAREVFVRMLTILLGLMSSYILLVLDSLTTNHDNVNNMGYIQLFTEIGKINCTCSSFCQRFPKTTNVNYQY